MSVSVNLEQRSLRRQEMNYISICVFRCGIKQFCLCDRSFCKWCWNGWNVYVLSSRALGGMYRQNRVRMNRAYLHMVLHCILHHVTRRKGRDKTLWNISCDIAVESIIDHWHLKCIHMVQTRLRKDIYGQLERNLKVLTAEGFIDSWFLLD